MRRSPAILAFVALAALAAPPAPAGPQPSREVRGLWVVRTALVSPEAVDQVLDSARAGGFNALFVQVRGRGDAFYRSRTSPRSPLLQNQPAAFDPLGRLIAGAGERGLEVHAWINVLLSAHFGQPLPEGHVLREHPDWAMVPRGALRRGRSGARLLEAAAQVGRSQGEAEGHYLSPSVPAVAEYLEAVVRELVEAYPVQGLHLDFVRYPGPEYDYSAAALAGFRARHGGEPGRAPAAWDEYRRDALSRLVERLAGAARACRPGLMISGAVVADDGLAVGQRFQDWPGWIRRGVLDAVCPMAYTTDTRLFRGQVERALTLAGTARPVWAGVGAYRLSVEGIVEKVLAARAAGAAGVVLFSHESLQPADWPRLRDRAFPEARSEAVAAASAAAAAAPAAPQ